MEKCVFHDDVKVKVLDHEERITHLEINEAGHEAHITALCSRLDDLITVIKWFIGTTLTGIAALTAILQYF